MLYTNKAPCCETVHIYTHHSTQVKGTEVGCACIINTTLLSVIEQPNQGLYNACLIMFHRVPSGYSHLPGTIVTTFSPFIGWHWNSSSTPCNFVAWKKVHVLSLTHAYSIVHQKHPCLKKLIWPSFLTTSSMSMCSTCYALVADVCWKSLQNVYLSNINFFSDERDQNTRAMKAFHDAINFSIIRFLPISNPNTLILHAKSKLNCENVHEMIAVKSMVQKFVISSIFHIWAMPHFV